MKKNQLSRLPGAEKEKKRTSIPHVGPRRRRQADKTPSGISSAQKSGGAQNINTGGGGDAGIEIRLLKKYYDHFEIRLKMK